MGSHPNDIDTSFETEISAEIVAAYVSNNPIAADQLPKLIAAVFKSVTGVAAEKEEAALAKKEPAVTIRKSLQQEHLIYLEDGKKFKSLKRHIRTHHDLTPEQYRERWGLKPDYPMVAPAYAARRSELAKTIGLGTKSGRKKK
ncbi:MucR family transcriptional regulator [uncultured Kiloniella sp.]|uniref:MucR family transcriptional regulator n=1 Tax=uncultured Kiloniella sp. TaxID=1133091 RepID=UPI002607F94D|nr:MucR family transcriptional regulator [uncultured Kiloniella sp.]